MKVIYTEKSQLLAARVARHLGCRIAEVKYNTFPDGEQYVRVMDLDDDMVIVASTVDSQSVLQAILMLDACEGKNTTLVLPYMGYARQDKRFNDGEPISTCIRTRSFRRGGSDLYREHPRPFRSRTLQMSG